MFREMRRKKQALPDNETIRILETASHGVLAAAGDDGYPYAVPLSFVYSGGRIYFHCAREGHKLDAIKSCPKVSFCVVSEDNVVPEDYTTYYRSVIAFGRARILQNEDEIIRSLSLLAEKYHPTDTEENRREQVTRELEHLCMVEVEIEHLSGKEAKELMLDREKRK